MKAVAFEGKEVVPSKVVCVGRNYVEHIAELHNEIPDSIVLFTKPNSSVTSTLRFISDDCRFEAEICFIVKAGKLAGVGVGLDLTKRDTQDKLKAKGLPWERAKAFDGAAVFSAFVSLKDALSSLRLELFVNGVLVQEGGYGLMIHKPEDIRAEISSFMTLEDGDILMTGTPKGVGNYRRGDVFIGKIFAGERILVEKTWTAA